MKKRLCISLLIVIIIVNLCFNRSILALQEDNYQIDSKNNYIMNIQLQTTVKDFKSKISKKVISIINYKGQDITNEDEAYITTGSLVTIGKETYATIVNGDLDGDGIYSYKDVLIEEDYIQKGETDRNNNLSDFGSASTSGYSSNMAGAPNASSLTLFAKTKSDYQNQHFAITDIGTSSQIIWYGCNDAAERSRKEFVVRAYSGANGNNVGYEKCKIVFQGGGHQVFDVKKSGSGYHIYTGAWGTVYKAGKNANGSTIVRYMPKGINMYTLSSFKSGTVRLISPSSSSPTAKKFTNSNTNYVTSFGVDEVTGKMVAQVTNEGTYEYNLNKSNISSSSKGKQIKHVSAGQGGCLSGNYFYTIGGMHSDDVTIACYDISTGNEKWKKTYNLKSKVGSGEPEGIQVYNYRGSDKIFIGFIRDGHNTGIYYFNN